MATITSAASGNSNTGATWVGGVVPGPADDVVIAGHVITLNADHTWKSLTLSSTAARINPNAGPRILNIDTFWRHSAAVAASACVPPASCNFTVNLGYFDHTTNQTQYTFGITNANVTLNISSNNATPANGNLLDQVGIATTLLITCNQATASITVNGYFDTASGQVTLFNMSAGTLVVNSNFPHNPGTTASSKILVVTGTGVVNATLNGPCNSLVAQSTTGLVTVSNSNATVTINGDWYQAVTNNPGALLHVSAGLLILNGKATHVAGSNTLTIWVAGGTFRWESQTVTINVSESVTIYASAGLLDFDGLIIENYNKFVGVMIGTSSFSSTGAVLTNYAGASGAINFMTLTTVNTEDPSPTLPPVSKVEAGEVYGYAASPLTGTGLVIEPSTLATAVGSALDNISATALARFVTVNTGESSAASGSVASFGGGLDAAGVRTAIGLASANLDTQLLNIINDTNELQTEWANGGRLDNLLDAANNKLDDIESEVFTTQTKIDNVEIDTQDIQNTLGTVISPNIDNINSSVETLIEGVHVTSIANNSITQNSIASGSITSEKIAVDAISSNQISSSAVSKIQTGLATSSALTIVDNIVDNIKAKTDLLNITPGGVDANIKAISDDTMAANNAELFFDGTGYEGTNNSIGTVINTVNLPVKAPDNWITSGVIATNAIGSAQLDASAINEIQAGLATSGFVQNIKSKTDMMHFTDDNLHTNIKIIDEDAKLSLYEYFRDANVLHGPLTSQATILFQGINDQSFTPQALDAIRMNFGLSGPNLDNQLEEINTDLLSIKNKTNQLSFTSSGYLDSNIQLWRNNTPGNLDSNSFVPSNITAINGNTTRVTHLATALDNEVFDATISSRSTQVSVDNLSSGVDTSSTWGTILPGSFPSGSAGYILGNNLDKKITDISTSSLSPEQENLLQSIKNKTDLISTKIVTVTTSIITSGTNFQLIKQDDYFEEESRNVTWSLLDTWPSLTGAQVIFKLVSFLNREIVCSVDSEKISVEIPSSFTNLSEGRYKYRIIATLPNSHIISLVQGTMTIV